MKAKLRKTYNIAVRVLIFVFTAYFLYDKIFIEKDIISIIHTFGNYIDNENFNLIIAIVVLLMIVNLSLESKKWQFLISKLEKVSFLKSFEAVLTGISVSMFLPNRTGDYLGRVFILKNANRIQATLSTILGSFAQLITTILFGLLSLIMLYPSYFDLSDNLYLWGFIGAIIAVLVIYFIMIFIYVEFFTFTDILKKITGREYKRIKKYAQVFSWYTSKDLSVVLIISILRYLVFSFQFFLLLRLFGVDLNYFHAMMLIGAVYLTMAVIPTIALSEIGIRGSVSVYIFQWWLETTGKWTFDSALGVLAASTSLWFLNIALPALVGTLFIFNLRFFRKEKKK